VTEKILPPDNPQTYARLDKLARCLAKEGKYDHAEELYLRAQEFWRHAPSRSGDECRAKFALGSLYVDEKKYGAAAPILARALSMAEDINGPASALLVPYIQRYSYALYHLKRKPEVNQLRSRADTISGASK